MLIFISWILAHRWTIPVALAAGLILGFGFLKIQNNHLRHELAQTESNLKEATETAMANAEAIRKMAEFQAKQEVEIKRVIEESQKAVQVAEEIKRKSRSARKTIGDAPIAPVIRDGLDLLYSTRPAANPGGSGKPEGKPGAAALPASPTTP